MAVLSGNIDSADEIALLTFLSTPISGEHSTNIPNPSSLVAKIPVLTSKSLNGRYLEILSLSVILLQSCTVENIYLSPREVPKKISFSFGFEF